MVLNLYISIVTGGCGFIGSHLCDLLLSENHKVFVIDNFSTGRIENLDHLKSNPNLKIEKLDLTDEIKVLEYLNKFEKIDYVFHLAALADIVPSIEHPEDYFKSNIIGTFNLLQAIKKFDIKKFLYTASSSCYGIPKIYPTKEDAQLDPKYPYALTKLIGEEISMHWGKVYKIPVISLRLFNVYGPRSRTSGTYGAVFGVFLAQKLANKPLTVVGDGTQTRDFTYVSDVANAFVLASQSIETHEIFNVGSGQSYSINYLVDLLNSPHIFLPKRPGEPDITHAAIDKITSKLGWYPKVKFEKGVKIMIDNIHYWKDAPVWEEKTINKATESWFKFLE